MTTSANRATGFDINLDACSGLDLAIKGGAVLYRGVWKRVNNTVVGLCDDATNYIQVDAGGGITVNQTGWTAGHSWLFIVTTVSGLVTEFQDWTLVPGRRGATVTQQTDKSTGVTINAQSGAITLNNAELAAGAEATFTVTNARIQTGDTVDLTHASAGTSGAYGLASSAIVNQTSFDITVSNLTAGALSEAIVINFTINPGATS